MASVSAAMTMPPVIDLSIVFCADPCIGRLAKSVRCRSHTTLIVVARATFEVVASVPRRLLQPTEQATFEILLG
jgi:hypothetical protein